MPSECNGCPMQGINCAGCQVYENQQEDVGLVEL